MTEMELKKKYNVGRNNLLLLVIFSTINVFTIVLTRTYFLFSLSFPRYPILGIETLIAEGRIFKEDINYVSVGSIMFIPIILFLLCYIFSSKNRYNILLLSIILFSIDFGFTIIIFDYLDIVFHVYIYAILIFGYINGKKLETFITTAQEHSNNTIDIIYDVEDSIPLRDDKPKGRVLVGINHLGMDIVVKRRRKITELIIDGKVYAEFVGYLELKYRLVAFVNNRKVSFYFDGLKMHLYVNDVLLYKKIRFY